MAHVFVPDGVRCVIQAENTVTLQEVLNVVHVQVPMGPPSYADCFAINSVLAEWVHNFYKNMFPLTIAMRQFVSTGMNAVPAAQASLADYTAGIRAGEMWPTDKTLCLKASTHASGRRRRGRVYSFPATENDRIGDQVTLPYAVALTNVWNTLLSRMTSAGYTLAVFSPTDAALRPIAEFVGVDFILDEQRRRAPGRGR
jgi:hypothetical protein